MPGHAESRRFHGCASAPGPCPALSKQGGAAVRWALLFLGLFCSSGCTALTIGGKVVNELRDENDRLLAEFRAERDRRQELEKKLRMMEDRLAESEKLLARQYTGAEDRLSQLSRGPSAGYSQSPFSSDLQGFSPSNEGGGRYGTADPDSGLRWQRRAGR